MTVTKETLIKNIVATGITKKEATRMLETLLETIKSALEGGEDILITSFGKFCVKEKKERRWRSPRTEEDMILNARRIVTFKCSGVLNEKLNRGRARR
jgi:integration host factor subunit alpha